MNVKTWTSMVIECADNAECKAITNFLVPHFPNVDINILDDMAEPYIIIEYQDKRTIDVIVEALSAELP